MDICFPNGLLCLALTAALGGCSSGVTLPPDGSPSQLEAFSGDGQEGTVGTLLPDPLVVRLTDGALRPVSGVSLRFQFRDDAPAARVEPSTVSTDDSGFASVQVRLGTMAGPQTVEAALEESAPADLRAAFGLTALAREPGNENKGGGGGDDHGGGDHGDEGGAGQGDGNGHGHGDGHGSGQDRHDDEHDD